jgi:putative aldouronate transport system substrate-binding protein
MKKISVLLCLMTALSLIGLWANGGSQSAVEAKGDSTEGKNLGTAPSYPLSDGSKAFKWWYPIDSRVLPFMTSYAENLAFQEIMKKTGIKIEFIHPSPQAVVEQFNLMIASGDLPDLIHTAQRYSGGEQQAYLDGVYKDLTPWVQNSAPDYYNLINSTAMAKKQVYKDGKVLAFYRLCFDFNPPYHRPIFRDDWLKEWGMTEPQTLDDYEKYFQSVLDKKKGALPYYINFESAPTMDLFMGAYDMLYNWYQINGKVYHYYDGPKYKEFLTRINQWYSKGYLTKDFATLKTEQVYALFDTGQLGGFAESVDVTFARLYGNQNVSMASAPNPRLTANQMLHTGTTQWPVNPSIPDTNVITLACKDVETAVKFLNFGYTKEGSMIYNFGKEGLTYTMVNGEPQFTEYYTNNPNGITGGALGYTLKMHLGPKLALSDSAFSKAQASDQRSKESYANRLKWADDKNVDDAYRLLPVNLTSSELEEYNAIMIDVNAYANEMKLKFITGAESLNNYDAYITRLNQLKFQRAKEIQQTAYDRIK